MRANANQKSAMCFVHMARKTARRCDVQRTPRMFVINDAVRDVERLRLRRENWTQRARAADYCFSRYDAYVHDATRNCLFH